MLKDLYTYLDFEALRPLIFLVQKPLGFSSFTVVDIFRNVLNDKAGHAGTLDPLATGELLILTGYTTKLTQQFISIQKTYKTTFIFGIHTDSLDLEQPIQIQNNPIDVINQNTIRKILQQLSKKQQLTVSKYSAIKQQGKPLYKQSKIDPEIKKDMQILKHKILNLTSINGKILTQLLENKFATIKKNHKKYTNMCQNLNIPIHKKQIILFENLEKILQEHIEKLTKYQNTKFYLLQLKLTVTKGTYIRVLANEIGKQLNTYVTTLDIQRINTYKQKI